MRVMIAMEQPNVSDFLKRMVQEEHGVVIVGQAENVNKSLALARQLRPDVAIIDCGLPYAAGRGKVKRARIGGLDAAQAISEEIPNTRVMLLNNLDDVRLTNSFHNSDSVGSFARETIGDSLPLTLRQLSAESKGSPVFARVEVKKQIDAEKRGRAISDEICLWGGVGIFFGLILMISAILFLPGLFLFSAGVLLLAVGLIARFVMRKVQREESR